MKKEVFTEREILDHASIPAELFQQLVKKNIIKPLGTTNENLLVFSSEVLMQLKEISLFHSMGYSMDEIEKIHKKVGLPSTKKTKGDSPKKIRYLTVGDLANHVDINPRTIKYWEERGIIEPDTRSDGGFRLYSEHWIYLCNLIKDLQLFGYTLEDIKEISVLFRDFLAIENSSSTFTPEEVQAKLTVMKDKIKLFYAKMNDFKEGIQRWEELLKKKEKEIRQMESKLKQTNKPDESKE
ncbi:MAG: MerR family transcriptional regulator [Candidatus Zhuqueibacterota bacterium]